jgi:hypothetical protein
MPIASGRIGSFALKARPGNKGPRKKGFPWRSPAPSRFVRPVPAVGATPALFEDWSLAAPSGNFSIVRSTTGTYIDNTGTRQTAAINAPRMHCRWNGTTWSQIGLLCEAEPRTNLAPNSDSVYTSSLPGWTGNNCSTASSGTLGADNSRAMTLVTASTATTTVHNVYSNPSMTITQGDVCHAAFDIKFTNRRYIYCYVNGNLSYAGAVFDFQTATITEAPAGGSGGVGVFDVKPFVEVLRNGIYRIRFSFHLPPATGIYAATGFVNGPTNSYDKTMATRRA